METQEKKHTESREAGKVQRPERITLQTTPLNLMKGNVGYILAYVLLAGIIACAVIYGH